MEGGGGGGGGGVFSILSSQFTKNICSLDPQSQKDVQESV